jgi:hypothetical protein
MNHDGDIERTGTDMGTYMMSDEMAMLTISGAIVLAVMMLTMFMRKA